MASQAVAETIAAVGVLPRLPPKRMTKQPVPTPRARAPSQHHSPPNATVDRGLSTTTSPTRTPVKIVRRWSTQAQPGREPGTRLTRMGVAAKLAPH